MDGDGATHQLFLAPGTKTGYKGIEKVSSKRNLGRPFRARHGKCNIGYYPTAEEAAIAYSEHVSARGVAETSAIISELQWLGAVGGNGVSMSGADMGGAGILGGVDAGVPLSCVVAELMRPDPNTVGGDERICNRLGCSEQDHSDQGCGGQGWSGLGCSKQNRADLGCGGQGCGILSRGDFSCDDLSCSGLSCGDLGRGDLGRGDLGCGGLGFGNLSRGDLSCDDLGCSGLSCSDLGCRDLGCSGVGSGDLELLLGL